ncbi:hypothetical protein [Thomasclavelia sp.]
MAKVGIDKIKLYNINLYSIDFEKLLSSKNKANVKVEFDNSNARYSSKISMQSLKYLRIIDNRKFVEFIYYSKNRYTFNRDSDNAAVHLTVSVSNVKDSNIENLTINEYREFIYIVIIGYLRDRYGLKVDVSKARITNLEINTTIPIDFRFKEYKRVLDVFFSTLPRTLQKFHEYSTVNDCYEKENETCCASSSNFKLIIYNKKKAARSKKETSR